MIDPTIHERVLLLPQINDACLASLFFFSWACGSVRFGCCDEAQYTCLRVVGSRDWQVLHGLGLGLDPAASDKHVTGHAHASFPRL